MSKAKRPISKERDIVLRLTWHEAGDLMQQLSIHKGCLRAEIKRLNKTYEERENFYDDGELEVTEEWLKFTRDLDSRLLRIYRRWQKRNHKEVAQRLAEEQALRERGEGDPDEIPF